MTKTFFFFSLPLAVFLALFPAGRPFAVETRLLVLPFEVTAGIADTPMGTSGTAMLEACLSESEGIALVERGTFNLLLEESALSLKGLTAAGSQMQAGRITGAEVIAVASLHLAGEEIAVSIRAFDGESGTVLSSHEERGRARSFADILQRLCTGLSKDLGAVVPGASGSGTAEDAASLLHFMRGLNFTFAIRHERALAEFMAAAGEAAPSPHIRLWMAKSFVALGRYGNACLEVSTLSPEDIPEGMKKELLDKLALCRSKLGKGESRLLEELKEPDEVSP